MKIFYVSGYSKLGSNAANLTHVLYMADALSRRCVDCKLVLFVSIADLFNIKKKINNIDKGLHVNIVPVPFINFKGIYFVFDTIATIYAILFSLLGYKIYTRNCRFAKIFYKLREDILIELHDFSEMTQTCLSVCSRAQFISISSYLATEIRKQFGNRDVFVLPDAALLTDETTSTGLDLHHKSIVYAGSGARGKGLQRITVFARRLPDIHFYVLGIEGVSCLENLTYLGYASKSTVAMYLRCADLLIAPYEQKVFDNAGNEITNYMSPLKVYEYMASGTPFMITSLPFVNDIPDIPTQSLILNNTDSNWILQIENFFKNSKQMTNEPRDFIHTWERRVKILMQKIKNK